MLDARRVDEYEGSRDEGISYHFHRTRRDSSAGSGFRPGRRRSWHHRFEARSSTKVGPYSREYPTSSPPLPIWRKLVKHQKILGALAVLIGAVGNGQAATPIPKTW